MSQDRNRLYSSREEIALGLARAMTRWPNDTEERERGLREFSGVAPEVREVAEALAALPESDRDLRVATQLLKVVDARVKKEREAAKAAAPKDPEELEFDALLASAVENGSVEFDGVVFTPSNNGLLAEGAFFSARTMADVRFAVMDAGGGEEWGD